MIARSRLRTAKKRPTTPRHRRIPPEARSHIFANVHTSEPIDNSVCRWCKTMFGYVISAAIILMLLLRISVGFVGAFVVGIVVFLLWWILSDILKLFN